MKIAPAATAGGGDCSSSDVSPSHFFFLAGRRLARLGDDAGAARFRGPL